LGLKIASDVSDHVDRVGRIAIETIQSREEAT